MVSLLLRILVTVILLYFFEKIKEMMKLIDQKGSEKVDLSHIFFNRVDSSDEDRLGPADRVGLSAGEPP